MAKPAPQPSPVSPRARRWTLLAVVCSMGFCGAIFWMHTSQEQSLDYAAQVVAGLGQAPLDPASREELSNLRDQAERRFRLTLALALLLLGGGCASVYAAARAHGAAIRSLHTSEERLRTVGDNLPDAYVYRYSVDAKGKPVFLHVSAGVEQVHGCSRADALGDAYAILGQFPGEQLRELTEAARVSAERMEDIRMELTVLRRDGSERRIRIASRPRRTPAGAVEWDGVATDITERVLAERALTEGEARFRALFEQAADGIVLISREGLLVDANPCAAEMFGEGREGRARLLGRPVRELRATSDERFQQTFARVEAGETVFGEVSLRRADGGTLAVEAGARRLSDRLFLVTFRDLTERGRSRARADLHHAVAAILAEGEPLLPTSRRITQRIGEILGPRVGAVWQLDRSNRLHCAAFWADEGACSPALAEAIQQANPAVGEGLAGGVWASAQPASAGRDVPGERSGLGHPTEGLHWATAFPVLVRGEVRAVLELIGSEGHPPDAETLALLGTIGRLIGGVAERRELEAQFHQAQKMEALGTLAGGIAHDFNNILTAIVSYTSLAQVAAEGNAELSSDLEEIARAGARATDLVRQILAFSRRSEQARAPVQIRSTLGDAVRLLRATLPSTIEVVSSIPADLPLLVADPTRIHQIVMNLGTNGWHAMRDRAGVLEIRAETVPAERVTGAPEKGERAPDRYVRLSVRDTGCGMDAATRERIFEPFFTTKARGEGTGLGLAVVHGIVQSHGGVIRVESEVGVGSTFVVDLPAAPEDARAPEAGAAIPPLGAGQAILVVDDEPAVARSTERILNAAGYSASSCLHPSEALERIRRSPGEIALLLTDHALPSMTGLDLAIEVHRLRPDLPIVLTTGNTADVSDARARAAAIAATLPKPSPRDRLLAVVHDLLSGAREGEARESGVREAGAREAGARDSGAPDAGTRDSGTPEAARG